VEKADVWFSVTSRVKELTTAVPLIAAILLEIVSLASRWTCVQEPRWKSAFYVSSPMLSVAALVFALLLPPRRQVLWSLWLLLPAAVLYIVAVVRVAGVCAN